MRFRSSFLLLYCSILPFCLSSMGQLFDDSETEDYNLFAPDDFSDQSAQSLFPFTDLLSYNDPSMSPFLGTDLLADTGAPECTSFDDSNQNLFISKRDETPRSCPSSSTYGVKRTNPGKYPGFNPDADPLVQVGKTNAEDEEFCPNIGGLPSSFLICDSGSILDRELDIFSGQFDLNNCRQSKTFMACPSLFCCCSKRFVSRLQSHMILQILT